VTSSTVGEQKEEGPGFTDKVRSTVSVRHFLLFLPMSGGSPSMAGFGMAIGFIGGA